MCVCPIDDFNVLWAITYILQPSLLCVCKLRHQLIECYHWFVFLLCIISWRDRNNDNSLSISDLVYTVLWFKNKSNLLIMHRRDTNTQSMITVYQSNDLVYTHRVGGLRIKVIYS